MTQVSNVRRCTASLMLFLPLLISSCTAAWAQGTSDDASLRITADRANVFVGKSVAVTAIAKRLGQPIMGQELWAYRNGRQWGAQGITDATGTTTFLLPLPTVGNARIQVAFTRPDFAWPSKTFGQTADFVVGTPLPPQVVASNLLSILVKPRKISPTVDPEHLIGTPWYPWFTRYNAHINGGHGGSEGVPLLGSYASATPDVIRQQMLWLDEISVNFVQVDWSNNLTSAMHWKDHVPGVTEMIASTEVLLDTLAQMRREGLPTPQVILLLGMAPPFSMAALNEEMQFVHDTYITNPKYAGLFLMYGGKPLATILSVLEDARLEKQGPVDKTNFTIRWEWVSVFDRPGWWSWTDEYLPPTTAYFNGKAESLSITSAISVGPAWKSPKSLGKRGGSTWMQGFQAALATRPNFLTLHQFNEWQEQYSTEMSDEFEPGALASLGDGGTGVVGGAGPGWGFYYLNLARAFVQIYHGQAPESTVLTVASPLRDANVSGPSVAVSWQAIGKAVSSYTIALDGAVKARMVHGNSYDLSLAGVAHGKHTVTVRADGAVTRFPLSLAVDDEPTAKTMPCSVSVPFTY